MKMQSTWIYLYNQPNWFKWIVFNANDLQVKQVNSNCKYICYSSTSCSRTTEHLLVHATWAWSLCTSDTENRNWIFWCYFFRVSRDSFSVVFAADFRFALMFLPCVLSALHCALPCQFEVLLFPLFFFFACQPLVVVRLLARCCCCCYCVPVVFATVFLLRSLPCCLLCVAQSHWPSLFLAFQLWLFFAVCLLRSFFFWQLSGV